MLTYEQATSVSCPTCRARAKSPCRRPSGHKASELHADRVLVAESILFATTDHDRRSHTQRLADGPMQAAKPQTHEIGGLFGEIATQQDLFRDGKR